ncbi:MAG: penicillin-binding protein 2, partial [Gammaproteobacteria bacterium]|nr:penicillin-binding protein 2 [Gammaproteobacteria bacterium]
SFKPFPIAAALETGEYEPETPIDTAPGFLKVSGYVVQDDSYYGLIDVTTVLTKSVNLGASLIALSLEQEYLWSSMVRFGFGSVAGVGLPGEVSGKLSHYQRWRAIGQATLGYGYGLSVTPVQLAQAYAVIAADGIRRPLSIVKTEKPGANERIISQSTAMKLRRMMEAVTSDTGTGARATVDGYRVAGKTGTARKVEAGNYSEERHVSVFAGMAPATRPRLATIVIIDEPNAGEYYGGEVAAPVFSKVIGGALRLLNVPPDEIVRPEKPATMIIAARPAP